MHLVSLDLFLLDETDHPTHRYSCNVVVLDIPLLNSVEEERYPTPLVFLIHIGSWDVCSLREYLPKNDIKKIVSTNKMIWNPFVSPYSGKSCCSETTTLR